MDRTAVTALLVLLLTSPGSASAQSPWGSRGFSWQPQIELAKEELARLRAELDRLPLIEWRQRSLAWVAVEEMTRQEMRVPESYRVAELVFRRRAEIQPLGAAGEPSGWRVIFAGKPPRSLAMRMTDRDATRVLCPLTEVLTTGVGQLGVFQHQGVLLCLPRVD